jgi:hypothetical protein
MQSLECLDRDLTMSADLDVSLEPHLLHVLRPLPQIASADLAERLRPYVNESPPSTIPHSVLQAVSQWSRTTTGIAALNSNSPSLDAHAYSMISLLAGVTTSPEGKFGEYIPPKEPEQLEAEKNGERKAITALINALLSIGGAAFAAWWAAEKTGWKNEYVCCAVQSQNSHSHRFSVESSSGTLCCYHSGCIRIYPLPHMASKKSQSLQAFQKASQN